MIIKILFSFNVQSDRPQKNYKYSMNLTQVITGVKYNCTAAMQGAYHALHLTLPQCRRLAKERLVNHTGAIGSELDHLRHSPAWYQLLYAFL